MKFLLTFLFAAITTWVGAQITIQGPILQPAYGAVTDPWGRKTPVDIRGRKHKRYKITIDDRNQTYTLNWKCSNGDKVLKIYTYTPPCTDIRDWVRVCACDSTMPDTSVVYFSPLNNSYIHKPRVIDYDRQALQFYHLNLPE